MTHSPSQSTSYQLPHLDPGLFRQYADSNETRSSQTIISSQNQARHSSPSELKSKPLKKSVDHSSATNPHATRSKTTRNHQMRISMNL